MCIHPALPSVLADPSGKTPLLWDRERLTSEFSACEWRITEGMLERVQGRSTRNEGLAGRYDEAMRGAGRCCALCGGGYVFLAEIIGRGEGLGCGTGLSADDTRERGYRPVSVDIPFDMLRHARNRCSPAALLPPSIGTI